MPQQKLSKNLPKRCLNERLKNRRKQAWGRGQDRKKQRRKVQAAAELANRQRHLAGQSTPWEQQQSRVQVTAKVVTDDKVQVVSPHTSYPHIRQRLDRFLGEKGITIDYLDQIHWRWTRLGKMIQKGVR